MTELFMQNRFVINVISAPSAKRQSGKCEGESDKVHVEANSNLPRVESANE